jgi:hypothetical protein
LASDRRGGKVGLAFIGSVRHILAMEGILTSDYSISDANFISVHRPDAIDNFLSAVVGGASDEKVSPCFSISSVSSLC